jgi:D-glycero-D-manno-heptose 1,7-bisphosphate phosphatase
VKAVFLDRDGTIIEDAGYLADPAKVRLLPGAGRAIRRLNQAGFRVLVVTNQSGIARGLLSLDDYRATERRLDELLTREKAQVDAHYFCPHLPEVNGQCECRKPGTLLYRQAAERFGIDLCQSFWIGDRVRDLVPAKTLGGKGILVLTGAGGSEAESSSARVFNKAADLNAAVDLIIRSQESGARGLQTPDS